MCCLAGCFAGKFETWELPPRMLFPGCQRMLNGLKRLGVLEFYLLETQQGSAKDFMIPNACFPDLHKPPGQITQKQTKPNPNPIPNQSKQSQQNKQLLCMGQSHEVNPRKSGPSHVSRVLRSPWQARLVEAKA